jgi:hypothetical protein
MEKEIIEMASSHRRGLSMKNRLVVYLQVLFNNINEVNSHVKRRNLEIAYVAEA